MAADTYTPREMIDRLVGFDTTSRDSNLDLIRFVEDYLAGHGVASTLIYDETGAKANLFATVGPEVDGGVVLSGHTDVVPVDGQDWSSDPFTVDEREGRLYGRGTADMKSFSAIALALVPELRRRDLKVPFHFALSYDEEVGCLGVGGLVEHLRATGLRPQGVIVGEPTDMKVVNAHKTSASFRVTVTGLESHSSATHKGVNSIFYAAELVGFLARLAEEMKTDPSVNERFDPPYTTVHVGVISGGTAQNIIPRRTWFTWEYRAVPDCDGDALRRRFEAFARDEVLPRMRAVFADADIAIEQRASVPGLVPERDATLENLIMALAGSNQTYAVSYGTEAGSFQGIEIPTVVCGPGNIAQAHKPDEFIELAQVEACESFLRRLADHLAA